jgi:CRISPR-associated protein Cas2
MAQTVYLVSYDISDPERLRRVFKVMKGAGQHVQYSVFRCVLGDRAKEELLDALYAVIEGAEDQVLFVNLGPDDGRGASCIASLGRPYVAEERKAKIL